MATLTLKNVPERLHERLRESARGHRRSINQEAIVCLEHALAVGRLDPEALVARAREIRQRAGTLYVTDEALRAARDEGRP